MMQKQTLTLIACAFLITTGPTVAMPRMSSEMSPEEKDCNQKYYDCVNNLDQSYTGSRNKNDPDAKKALVALFKPCSDNLLICHRAVLEAQRGNLKEEAH